MGSVAYISSVFNAICSTVVFCVWAVYVCACAGERSIGCSFQVQCNSAVFLKWVGCREHEFYSKEAFKMCKIILIIVYYLSLAQQNFYLHCYI